MSKYKQASLATKQLEADFKQVMYELDCIRNSPDREIKFFDTMTQVDKLLTEASYIGRLLREAYRHEIKERRKHIFWKIVRGVLHV